MADYWTTDWLNRSDMFAPLRAVGASLPAIGWPNAELLNALAEDAGRIVNAQGQRMRFVEPATNPKNLADGFEQRAFLKGEVQVRRLNWHDLFNALVWMTFPTTKAVINARHYEESLSRDSKPGGQAGDRSPVSDALTLFDEDGMVVLSSDHALLDLVRNFRWKELFWARREEVRRNMRFFLFGHALYHKALAPFIGMTAKAVLLGVPQGFAQLALDAQLAATDRLLSAFIWDRAHMRHGRDLSPLPLLGVPAWWNENEQETFYDNAGYFRAGRKLCDYEDRAGSSSV